jgi:arylsulfatase A-like enzyme
MDDIILVTADSVRRDYAEHMPFVSGFDVRTGYTGAHYTRPSLASLLSSSFEAAIRSQPVSPTLPEVLSELDYTCIGLSPGPQTDPSFGFDDGFEYYDSFYEAGDNPIQDRTSNLREFLGQFDLVRDVYRKLFPMGALMDDMPPDAGLIDVGIEQFNAAESPRFLWIHLMGTHRPYGQGDDAVPEEIDHKSESLGGSRLLSPDEMTPEEEAIIDRKYRDALGRADAEIERLVDEVDGDPVFVFGADHGEELGEDGYYYHQGYRRRVVDTIAQVPVVFDGLDVTADSLSMLDIAPTLVSAAGGEPPESWHGRDLLTDDPEWAITIAPWHETATMRWTDFETSIVSRDADVSLLAGDSRVDVEGTEVDDDIEERLQALGYRDAG